MNEYNFETYLEHNLGLIEKDLKIVERQRRTYYGVIDLFCEDSHKKKVIVELKLNATIGSISQIGKYLVALIKEGYKKEELRAMLVSSRIDEPIKQVCEHFGIGTKEVQFNQSTLPIIPNETTDTLSKVGAVLYKSSVFSANEEFDPDKIQQLTDREISILYVISELNKRNEKAAYTNIAQILNLSPGTIRGFVNDMREKVPIHKEKMLPNGLLFYLSPEVQEYLEEKFAEFKRKFKL